MQFVVDAEKQARHYPQSYLVNGVPQPNPEVPERISRLREAALASGLTETRPTAASMAPIEAVHPARYLTFLQNAYERWQRIAGAAPEVTPNIHPDRRDCTYPASVVAQAGFHMLDASCPIAADTFDSACWSAWTATSAAQLVRDSGGFAYALCRPPGHHAQAEAAAGFCYLNNSAIAAQALRQRHERVAVLDIDLHHGNGTQDIFYRRRDVLTVSIHADPVRFYPFFWGSDAERGIGDGEGFNLNLPLPRGANDSKFIAALDKAFARIQEYKPGALVVALGLDAFAGDPFAGLGLTTKGFGQVGSRIAAALPMPSVLVQEGGYLCDELGANLEAFLRGFADAAADWRATI